MALWHSWAKLERQFAETITKSLDESSTVSRHANITRAFGLGRFDEGQAIADFLQERRPNEDLLVLDVGAGNGGVSLAISNHQRFSVMALDITVNQDLRALRQELPLKQLLGDGEHLPLRAASVDVALCLETLEHVRHPSVLGSEIMRVLRPGGLCMITTPARLRYWFAPDPHYGKFGLVLLPDGLQGFVARLLLGESTYDVSHIFWHLKEITRLFPGEKDIEVIWDKLPPFSDRVRTRIWWSFRYFLWNRIVLRKR